MALALAMVDARGLCLETSSSLLLEALKAACCGRAMALCLDSPLITTSALYVPGQTNGALNAPRGQGALGGLHRTKASPLAGTKELLPSPHAALGGGPQISALCMAGGHLGVGKWVWRQRDPGSGCTSLWRLQKAAPLMLSPLSFVLSKPANWSAAHRRWPPVPFYF